MSSLYPKKEWPTEFEVHAELYCKLKKMGFNVRGDVWIGNCHLDLIIYDKECNAKYIIEVKNYEDKKNRKKVQKGKIW